MDLHLCKSSWSNASLAQLENWMWRKLQTFWLYGPFPGSVGLCEAVLLKMAIAKEKELVWHVKLGRAEWRTGGYTISGHEGSEKQDVDERWRKLEAVSQKGNGLASTDSLLDGHSAGGRILLEQCAGTAVVGCGQVTNQRGWSIRLLGILFFTPNRKGSACFIHKFHSSHSSVSSINLLLQLSPFPGQLSQLWQSLFKGVKLWQ